MSNGTSATELGFGKEFRTKHFEFPEGYVSLNHGSFGAYPACVGRRLEAYRREANARPDTFLRYQYPSLLREARAAVAELVNARLDDTVLVANATTAFNVVIRNLVFEPDDVILGFDINYPSIAKTVLYVVERGGLLNSKGPTSHFVPWSAELSDDELVSRFEENLQHLQLQQQKRVRLAVFDTVSSLPGVRFPYEKLVATCKKYNVLSFVDAAHGAGHIPLDVGALDADFLTSNLHTWLFVPRGCAVLCVPQRNQHLIRSSIPTSHYFKPLVDSGIKNPLPESTETPFVGLFEFVGTLDTCNFLCIKDALAFGRDVCGGERFITEYLERFALKAGDAAAEILGTEVLDNPGRTLRRCAFANVRLPLDRTQLEDDKHVKSWIEQQSIEHETFLVVVLHNGRWWWRISAMLYLDFEDIIWTANLLKHFCDQINQLRALK